MCHTCDVRTCVNPAHLWVGTHADNVADMISKGRYRSTTLRGSASGSAKLTEADIPVIRKRLAAGEVQRVIAADYGVSSSTISLINRGINWSHIQEHGEAGTATPPRSAQSET